MACAFTDEQQIRIIDFRARPKKFNDATMVLEGEHTEFVKQIALSPDGT